MVFARDLSSREGPSISKHDESQSHVPLTDQTKKTKEKKSEGCMYSVNDELLRLSDNRSRHLSKEYMDLVQKKTMV